jgi:hypothetical protein
VDRGAIDHLDFRQLSLASPRVRRGWNPPRRRDDSNVVRLPECSNLSGHEEPEVRMNGVREEVRENEDRWSLGAHASVRFDGQLQSPPAFPREREPQKCQCSGSSRAVEPVDAQSVEGENGE